jgi:hypothetical protein
VILMTGSRSEEEWALYPVSELAARYGASAEEEATGPEQAYARFGQHGRWGRPTSWDRLPWAQACVTGRGPLRGRDAYASGGISRYWRAKRAISWNAGAATTPPQIAPRGSSTVTRTTSFGALAGTTPTKEAT